MSNGKNRPTAVLVIAIIGIAFGIMGICGGLIGLVTGAAGLQSPQMEQIPAHVQMWMNVLQGVSLALNVALLVASIGLIQMKSWARILSMVYASLTIPVSIVSTILTTKVMLPIIEKSMPQGAPPEAMKIGLVLGLGGGICCGLIYPIVLLVILNLKSVREAFTQGDSLPPRVT